MALPSSGVSAHSLLQPGTLTKEYSSYTSPQAPPQLLLVMENGCCYRRFLPHTSGVTNAFGSLMKAVGSLLRKDQNEERKCTYDVRGFPDLQFKNPSFTRLREKEGDWWGSCFFLWEGSRKGESKKEGRRNGGTQREHQTKWQNSEHSALERSDSFLFSPSLGIRGSGFWSSF